MDGSLVLFCDLIKTGVNYIKHFVRVWQLQGPVLWQSDTQQSFVLGWLLLDPISFRSLLGETSQPATEVNKTWDESTRKPDWNTAPSSRPLHNSRVCGHEEGEGEEEAARTACPPSSLNTRGWGRPAKGHQQQQPVHAGWPCCSSVCTALRDAWQASVPCFHACPAWKLSADPNPWLMIRLKRRVCIRNMP